MVDVIVLYATDINKIKIAQLAWILSVFEMVFYHRLEKHYLWDGSETDISL